MKIVLHYLLNKYGTLIDFSAAKAAQEMQMSVCLSVCPSVCMSAHLFDLTNQPNKHQTS